MFDTIYFMKKQSKKLNWERTLGLINVILTAIIGIFIAVFLNIRDEKLSIELAERDELLAVELQKGMKNSSAN